MTNLAESTWVRCDREAFEIEPDLEQFVRWAYAGELEALGLPEEDRDEYLILVTNLAPGIRGRKLIHLSQISQAIETASGMRLMNRDR